MGQNKTMPQGKPVTDLDTPAIKALWEQCFEDTLAFTDWYFQNYYKPENTLAIFADGQPVSSVQLVPYTIDWNHMQLPVRYIVGVDTHPAYRKRGYAKALLEASLLYMKEQGIGMSLLMPFDAEFYRRYGWEYGYYHTVIQCEASSLRGNAHSDHTYKMIGITAEAAMEQIPVLMKIYQRYTEDLQGMALRDHDKWRQILTDLSLDQGTVCLFTDGDAQIKGYGFRVTTKEGKILYSELVWTGEITPMEIMTCIGNGEKADTGVEIHLAEGNSTEIHAVEGIFTETLPKESIRRQPFMMVRIADVAKLLSQLRYPCENAEFYMGVTDGFASWNNGSYHVKLSGGVAEVCKEDNGDTQPRKENTFPVDFEVTVEALGQLITGTQTTEALMQTGLLKIHNRKMIPLLQSMQPKKPLFFNEYY